MYILALFPPIISIYMIFPVLTSLFKDTKKSDTQIMSVFKYFTAGYLVGIGIYALIVIFVLQNSLFINFWNSLDKYNYQRLGRLDLILGINLPIIFGMLLIYLKLKGHLNSKAITIKDITAGVIHVIFMVLYLTQFSRWDLAGSWLLLPSLAGLWFATKVSTHTWKYFAFHILLAFPSWLLFAAFSYG